MANTLGVYNPIFYAQEALIQLENALGMAGRVHRGIEEERNSFGKGETIKIRKPSTFTAQNAPSSSQDLGTETVTLSLDYWKEVKFELTDKELAFTQQRIIEDHIRPAAYALADDVDVRLASLHKDIPWYYDLSGTPVVADITGPRTVLFNNKVPIMDPAMNHFMIDGTLEGAFLGLSAFSQNQGAGDLGINTQLRGSLGTKYGFEIFANQNVQSHVKGTCSTTDLLVNVEHLAGVSVIDLDAAAVTGTLVAGDTFVIAGNTQRYAVTALNTAAANAFTNVAFTPPLVATAANNAAVTVRLDNHTANMMFHRNAFALATAPLPEIGNELGARVATINDPVTNLALRSRIYYIPDSSKVVVALDILFGLKTLDPNLAVVAAG